MDDVHIIIVEVLVDLDLTIAAHDLLHVDHLRLVDWQLAGYAD
jgi:hypothetical protein